MKTKNQPNNLAIIAEPLSISKQWYSAIVVAFGGVGLGLSLSWTATALPSITETQQIGHDLSPTEKSLIGSILTLGALISCPISAYAMNAFGRRSTLIYLSILALPGWIVLGSGSSFPHLCVGRILTGIYAGGATIVVPVFVKELASSENRGVLGSMFLIMICVGKLISTVVGILVSARYASLICAVHPILHACLLLTISESSTFLMNQQSTQTQDVSTTSVENGIQDQLQNNLNIAIEPVQNAINHHKFANAAKPITIVLLLTLLAQICGINVVTFFKNEMFPDSSETSQTTTVLNKKSAMVILCVVQVVGGFPTSIFVDRCGRKGLLLSSLIAMTISLATLSIYYCFFTQINLRFVQNPEMATLLPLSFLAVYCLAYSWGVGSIIWIIMSEIIPSQIIAHISSLANALYWTAAFLITLLYQYFSTIVPLYIWFFTFSVICVIGSLFVFFFLPETKGVSP